LFKLFEARLRLNEMAKDWRSYAMRIAPAARNLRGPSEVYVFGSVVKGLATGASNVDILIVSSQLLRDHKSRGDLKAEIEEKAGLPLHHPLEIHRATDQEAKEIPIYRSATKEGVAL